MKKMIAIALSALLLTSLAGCHKAQPVSQTDIQNTPVTSNNQTVSETVTDNFTTTETFAQNPNSPTLPEGAITSEEAVDVALKKAGLEKSQIIGLWSELDYDDGRLVYEVDFSDGKFDYDCTVDAQSGKVIEYDKEFDD